MRRLVPVVVLAGCTPSADPAPAVEVAWCEGATAQRYDPLADPHLALWPDGLWTRDDAASPTGLRLDVADAPWLPQTPTQLLDVAPSLEVLSGFARFGAGVVGTTAPLGALPATAAESTTDPGLVLADLTTTPPTRIPYRVARSAEGTQVLVQPLRPLRPGAAHALVLTTAHRAADGGCVAPSPTTRALVAGAADDARLARHAPAVRDALTALGLDAADVSVVAAWTTHDDAAVLADAAADARDRGPGWAQTPVCRDEDGLRRCDGVVNAWDYRDAGNGVLGVAAPTPWSLPVAMWLPQGTGPHPVLVVGHGMNGSRGDGRSMARELTSLGFAVVASDAMFHGDHPTRVDGGLQALPFLGLDLEAVRLDVGRLRGAFQQSPIDRAQVLAAVRSAPDVDGDGVDDLDPDRSAYLGISLGGLLGAGLLALDGGLGAAALPVGGGHLVTFATDNPIAAGFRPLFEITAGGGEAWDRFVVVMQSAVDPADPAVLGAHVGADRFDDAPAPDLLLQVALQDEVVPAETGRMLARGLGLPTVGTSAAPPDDLPRADAPVVGGGPDGATVGWFQLDRVSDGASVVPAAHDNTPWSAEAWLQTVRFFESWLDGGAVIVDPYAELGTPASP